MKITWVDPTANTDGSALAANEVTGYQIGGRVVAGGVAGTYTSTTTVQGAASTTADTADLQPALAVGVPLAFSIRTLTSEVDAKGDPVVSAWFTPEIMATLPVPAPVPNAPTGFSLA